MIGALRTDAVSSLEEVRSLQALVTQAYAAWEANVHERRAALLEDADRGLRRAASTIAAHESEARDAARVVAAGKAAVLAPGALGASWADEAWGRPNGLRGLGTGVRIGSSALSETDEHAAVILTWLGVPGWRVSASTDAFVSLVHMVMLRLLTALTPGRVRTLVFDPDLTADLGLFAEVRARERTAVPPAIVSAEEFEATLGVLVAELSEVDDDLTSRGYTDLHDAAGATGDLLHPIRLVVLNGPVAGLSDRGRHLLEQIVRAGSPTGCLVIAQSECVDLAATPALERLEHVVLEATTSRASSLPSAVWSVDGCPDRREVLDLARMLARAPRASSAPSVHFERLVAEIQDAWLDPGHKGLEAVIGVAGRAPLTLRLRSEDPPMPNVLVGGAVGQGKSNLLLVLVHALAARYSPVDLEMVLLDLRDGVEFSRLGPDVTRRNWLPHVKVLGLEFDRDFSVAVLRWVSEEMAGRAALLREAGVAKLEEYRGATGRPMPRLLVVVDEFQRLFEGDDDRVAASAALLEHIARTGRGFGVHLVLASQTITGIRGLAVKADAIFAQFHNRLSLKNTAAESQAILAPQNTAAAKLAHRGEVVVNDALGSEEANVTGVVAFADQEHLARLRERLWRDGAAAPPQVFQATAWADPQLLEAPESGLDAESRHDGLEVTVGGRIAVGSVPRRVRLSRSADQTMIVLGSDRALALSVLSRAVHTAVIRRGRGTRVLVLDGESPPGRTAPWLARLCEALGSVGAAVDRLGRGGIGPALAARVWASPSDGAYDLVVPMALDALTELDEPDPTNFTTPATELASLVQTGAADGTFVIGWWQSRSRLERHVGFGSPGVRAWALCGAGVDDARAICGPLVGLPDARPRFLFFDRTSSTGAETLVPFAGQDLLGPVDG